MAGKVPKTKFNNGQEFPVFGLGTWKSKPGEVTQAVKDALDIGYRHIDCAHVYGNEAEVGAALTAKLKDGTVKREDIYVTSKLWNTMHRPDLVEPAIKTTLKNLGLQYLDLYLIHWPFALKEDGELFPVDANGKTLFSDVDYLDTWKAMEDLVKKGLAKSIGVSNFNKKQMERLLANCTIPPATNQEGGDFVPKNTDGQTLFSDVDYVDTWKAMEQVYKKGLTKSIGVSNFNICQLKRLLKDASVKPAVNQVEFHPYLYQKELLSFCKDANIDIVAYAPLGSGGRPWAKESDPSVLNDPKISEVAKKYKKTTAQIILRFLIEEGLIPIPKSTNKDRIETNINVFDFELNAKDKEEIRSLNQNIRYHPHHDCMGHRNYPF